MQTWDGTTAQWPSEWQISPSDEQSGPSNDPLVAHPLIEPHVSIQPPSQICGPFPSQTDHFPLPALNNFGQPLLLDCDPRLFGDAQTSRPHDDHNVTNQLISPELLENNLKFGPQPSQGFKRKRPQSCDNCRSRKVRCTRTPPDSSTTDHRCLPCQSVDGSCTYDYIPKRPGPQSSASKVRRQTGGAFSALGPVRAEYSTCQAFTAMQSLLPDSLTSSAHDSGFVQDGSATKMLFQHYGGSIPPPPHPLTAGFEQTVDANEAHSSMSALSQDNGFSFRLRAQTPSMWPAIACPYDVQQTSKSAPTSGLASPEDGPDDTHWLGNAPKGRARSRALTFVPGCHFSAAAPGSTLQHVPSSRPRCLEDIAPRQCFLQVLGMYREMLWTSLPLVDWPTFAHDLLHRRDAQDKTYLAFALSLTALTLSWCPNAYLPEPKAFYFKLRDVCHRSNRRLQDRSYSPLTTVHVSTLISDSLHLQEIGQNAASAATFGEAEGLLKHANLMHVGCPAGSGPRLGSASASHEDLQLLCFKIKGITSLCDSRPLVHACDDRGVCSVLQTTQTDSENTPHGLRSSAHLTHILAEVIQFHRETTLKQTPSCFEEPHKDAEMPIRIDGLRCRVSAVMRSFDSDLGIGGDAHALHGADELPPLPFPPVPRAKFRDATLSPPNSPWPPRAFSATGLPSRKVAWPEPNEQVDCRSATIKVGQLPPLANATKAQRSLAASRVLACWTSARPTGEERSFEVRQAVRLELLLLVLAIELVLDDTVAILGIRSHQEHCKSAWQPAFRQAADASEESPKETLESRRNVFVALLSFTVAKLKGRPAALGDVRRFTTLTNALAFLQGLAARKTAK